MQDDSVQKKKSDNYNIYDPDNNNYYGTYGPDN